MPPTVGEPAPDFSLPAGPGPDRVTLSAFRGERPVVLFFYPLAFSGVCTDELCAVGERAGAWGELDAQVLALSVDSPFVTRRFAGELGADFPLLSDFNREATTAYDVVYDDFFGLKGVAKRAVFVVDRDGILRYVWVTEDADVLPDLDAVRSVLEQLAPA
ncbi:MAG TPA: redoxin domain-containing protein [Longimicrobiales bacterium]|nr:redoxin domain-containing protein [Longimicrobiales bacterium]